MTNLADNRIFIEEDERALPGGEIGQPTRAASVGKVRRSRGYTLTPEDQEIVRALNIVKRDIECLHNRYDQTTDPLMVDSIIYELKAAHMKHKYYLHLCKEKGIVGGV